MLRSERRPSGRLHIPNPTTMLDLFVILSKSACLFSPSGMYPVVQSLYAVGIQ